MKTMISEYIIDPIVASSQGNITGFGILFRVLLFLTALFAVIYGLPLWMVALG